MTGCLEDIRSIYIHLFYYYIANNTDEVLFGPFVRNIKSSMDAYLREDTNAVAHNTFRECIFYLGIALEELLARVYVILFEEPSPDISINALLITIHRKCKQNLRDPNILINKYIKKKLENKRNVEINERDFEEDFINIEKLILKDGSIFGSNLDAVLVKSRDIRNKAFHKSKKPIDHFDVLEMSIGVGMLFFWWKGVFQRYYQFPREESTQLININKKDLNTSKPNSNKKEGEENG